MQMPLDEAGAPGADRVRSVVPAAADDSTRRLLRSLTDSAVQPDAVLAGNPTGLLGTLWGTGGVWVVLAVVLGGFEGERPGLALAVGVAAVCVGGILRLLHDRALPVAVNAALTLLASAAITLVVVAGGQSTGAAAVVGVLFVYVTCFAFVAVPRYEIATVAVSAAGHLGVLLLLGRDDALPLWVLTWGTATVAGLLAGGVVQRLVEATERLREADAAKDRFVASVSHELRSPLAAILGVVETLEEHEEDLSVDLRRQLLRIVRRQTTRQQRLVEDVLLLSRRAAGAGAPRPEAVDLPALVQETLEVLDLEVVVDLGDSPVVLADPMHVQRVMENLLVNADRYGAPPVELRTRSLDDRVVLEVVDHGSGIPGGFEDALTPFRQPGRGGTGTGPGVGLGLAIVQDLVAANGGELAYRDTPGGGATVRTVWPTP